MPENFNKTIFFLITVLAFSVSNSIVCTANAEENKSSSSPCDRLLTSSPSPKPSSFLLLHFLKIAVSGYEIQQEIDDTDQELMFYSDIANNRETAIFEAIDADGRVILQTGYMLGTAHSIPFDIARPELDSLLAKLKELDPHSIAAVRFRHTHPQEVWKIPMFSAGDMGFAEYMRTTLDAFSNPKDEDLENSNYRWLADIHFEMVAIARNAGTFAELFTGPVLKKSTFVIPALPLAQ